MITIHFDIQNTDQQLNFQKGIEYLRKLKLPFRIETSPIDNANIVWDFPEPDTDWENIGLSAWHEEDDWECPEEWVELSKETTL